MSFNEKIQIWTLVITCFGVIVAAVGVVGVIIAARALKFSAWLRAQEIYVNDEFYNARNNILSHFGFKNTVPSRIGQGDEKSAIYVCQRMDELARLEKYLSQDEILEAWGKPMGKSWMILKKTVDDERNKGQEEKWDAFQRLAKIAIKKYNLKELNQKLATNKN